MKVVKEIFLTEEERDTLKKASEILDFISDEMMGNNEDDNFSFYKSPKELNGIIVAAHASCFEDCRDY